MKYFIHEINTLNNTNPYRAETILTPCLLYTSRCV